MYAPNELNILKHISPQEQKINFEKTAFRNCTSKSIKKFFLMTRQFLMYSSTIAIPIETVYFRYNQIIKPTNQHPHFKSQLSFSKERGTFVPTKTNRDNKMFTDPRRYLCRALEGLAFLPKASSLKCNQSLKKSMKEKVFKQNVWKIF